MVILPLRLLIFDEQAGWNHSQYLSSDWYIYRHTFEIPRFSIGCGFSL